MSQDNDNRKANNALMASLFKKHPYGTQTVLGKAEHLKNPSMINIHNYRDNYYVPNNMAVCLSGDLEFDKTIKLINQHFGTLKSKEVPKFVPPVEDSITKPIIKNVYGPDAEYGLHVDDADPADFQVVPQHFPVPADQDVFRSAGDLDDIVGNQPVAPFDEIQCTFTLADSTAPGEQKSHTVDVHQGTVNLGPG